MLVMHLDHRQPPGDVYVGSLFQLKTKMKSLQIFSPFLSLSLRVCVPPHVSTQHVFMFID